MQILGAGVGGMPYALKEAGFYAGILLIIIVAYSSDYSVRMLIRLGQKVNKKYYEQLVQSQFGHAGYVAVSAAMGIFAYGAMCAYLIGIGMLMFCTSIPPAASQHTLPNAHAFPLDITMSPLTVCMCVYACA